MLGLVSPLVHLLYIFNQHEFSHMYILVFPLFSLCFIWSNIPHVQTAVHNPQVQPNRSSTIIISPIRLTSAEFSHRLHSPVPPTECT